MAFRTFQAYLDDLDRIAIKIPHHFDTANLHFELEDKESHEIITTGILSKGVDNLYAFYSLQTEKKIDLESFYWVYDSDRNKQSLLFGSIVRKPVFDQLFTYEGDDLGAQYSPKETNFKLWAPISEEVLLHLNTPKKQVYPMTRLKQGIWQLKVDGDWDGISYHYLHLVNDEWIEVHDPYALSSMANSGDSFVINPSKLRKPSRAKTQPDINQAIIYEMSVRDFSSQPDTGFNHPGKFKGLAESPKLSGQSIGMDYVKNLGVTHVQLMPVYDFGSVDENHPQAVYNWGYDPVQYNIPDGSFATDPNNPYSRILELQEAIEAYHQADISLIMDVVYNHVYHAETYAFERLVPGYFYRVDDMEQRTNGTFCGNDVASERPMVNRYIRNSLKIWAGLYGFDGFRFDLMGILDIQTMNQVAQELKTIHPNIYLYGEGWNMGTGLHSDLLAHQYNAYQLPDFAFFSDDFRNNIKRAIADPNRLETDYRRDKLVQSLLGGIHGHFIKPSQALNYVECHDNATFYDYLAIKHPENNEVDRLAAARLALQLVLLSQGVAFIHSGQEFYRRKDLIDNSYNISDTINRLDWKRALDYTDDVQFYQQLISFRKNHPALSLSSYQAIQEATSINWLSPYLLEYSLETTDDKLKIIINFSPDNQVYTPVKGDETILVNYPEVSLKKPLEHLIEPIILKGRHILVLGFD
ncbi:Pullulanase [Streptococcus sp. DD10]|uniref:type I pullulanase n=1 Tax=Streptococcus sp. DD10 TaxID=1777878 RepID=UPI00079C4EA6|nr:type I pullulanase [Streptococcus sp. DD10]KXT74352.1 Pullulanase [Streptococcus sp. DD10]